MWIMILYILSNTTAIFEAQFIKKLSNTEAELKKSVVYRKGYLCLKIVFCHNTVLNSFMTEVFIIEKPVH